MDLQELKNIDTAVERLSVDDLFNPTDKPQWISKLIKEGLTERDAKHAYKLAAQKYHDRRNKLRNTKSGIGRTLGKAVGYTGAGILTFFVGPWIYLIIVLIAIAVLGFVFSF